MSLSNLEYMQFSDSAWVQLCSQVIKKGNTCFPRGRGTQEIINGTACFDMTRPIITMVDRKLNYKFMAAEAYWILSGRNDVEFLSKHVSAMKNFSDDGVFLSGAYGPAVVDQLPYIVKTLTEDKESRQAVMTIWRPRPGPSKDIPCTISVQFLIRSNMLFTVYNMRSSDVWLGVPYDWFSFSCLSAYVALLLRKQYPHLRLGTLSYNAGSCHMYDDDLVKYTSMSSNVQTVNGLFVERFQYAEDLLRVLLTHAEKGKANDPDIFKDC